MSAGDAFCWHLSLQCMKSRTGKWCCCVVCTLLKMFFYAAVKMGCHSQTTALLLLLGLRQFTNTSLTNFLVFCLKIVGLLQFLFGDSPTGPLKRNACLSPFSLKEQNVPSGIWNTCACPSILNRLLWDKKACPCSKPVAVLHRRWPELLGL